MQYNIVSVIDISFFHVLSNSHKIQSRFIDVAVFRISLPWKYRFPLKSYRLLDTKSLFESGRLLKHLRYMVILTGLDSVLGIHFYCKNCIYIVFYSENKELN